MCCYHCSASFFFLVINCENQRFFLFCLITLFLTFLTHHSLLPCCAELTRQLAVSLRHQTMNPLTAAGITSVFIRIRNAVTHRDDVLCCTERPRSIIHPSYGDRVPGMDMLRRPSPLTHPALTHKSLSKVSVRQARPVGWWPPPLFTYEPLQINQKLLCNNFHPLPSALIYLPSSSSLSGRISFSHCERLKSVYNSFPPKSVSL